jgi:glucose-1-phosphate thymidylyltransferase
MPFALDLAAPWIGDATTVFSMPDTLITPIDTVGLLVAQHRAQPADLTLGLFRTATPHQFGMVELGAGGAVGGFVDKPRGSRLEWMWGLAVWSPRFTAFLGAYVQSVAPAGAELVLSDVFAAALAAGLRVQGLPLEQARYRDIGTPEDFQSVVRELSVSGGAAPEAGL